MTRPHFKEYKVVVVRKAATASKLGPRPLSDLDNSPSLIDKERWH